MGWLSMPLSSMGGHATPKAYLDDQFTYSREQDGGDARGARVIASACPGNRAWYAAVELLANGVATSVIAVICEVRWTPNAADGYVFAYKNMTENAGPCSDECPDRILRLLSPTEDEGALDWRERCRTRLRQRVRPVTDGMRVRFPEPIRFEDGHSATEFIVVKRGARITVRCASGFGHYRIRNFRDLPWTVVPVTKVHTTVFAKPPASAMPA